MIINIDKDAPIPKPNVSGKWKDVIHDDTVIWLPHGQIQLLIKINMFLLLWNLFLSIKVMKRNLI